MSSHLCYSCKFLEGTENPGLDRCSPRMREGGFLPWWAELYPELKYRKVDSADARMGDRCPRYAPHDPGVRG